MCLFQGPSNTKFYKAAKILRITFVMFVPYIQHFAINFSLLSGTCVVCNVLRNAECTNIKNVICHILGGFKTWCRKSLKIAQ
jgi:hypothetical protein